jgi:hypothetical protein
VQQSHPNSEDWNSLLARLNSLILKSEKWQVYLTPEILSSGWCGLAPASPNVLGEAEQRLGARLPPSYKRFLSIANGWRPFSSFVESLLPVQDVDSFRVKRPEDLAMIQEYYQEDEISDRDYLDYETDKHNVAIRHRYYPDCLLVGTPWGDGGDLILLNSKIVFPNGEWEAIFFASWLPGNERYRSFRELVEERVSRGL